ncbi:hypothetical protein FGG08_007283 [Glutinoglossum americanum]|uniref:C2H2-type domain-containing protein n=1 Tax=Glutinoglossum americanum TaxID=1670608 RepID=A0A9P8HZ76_9PEZI|nr:hypothetical protein FGG08_007283 [Glutinoglossum americanum]
MSDPSKKSAYDTPPTDTSFRKTWNKADYAAQAATRESQERTEARLRYEAKSLGKTYHSPAPSTPSTSTTARTARLNIASQIGKTQLIPSSFSTSTKRGRSAGFYCEDCDLTFKDNLQWVDHLNSKGHLVRVGESGVVERVGVEVVRERLAWLREKRKGEMEGEGEGLRERLERRKGEEERERVERRERRRVKRRKGGQEEEVGGDVNGDGEGVAVVEEDMMKAMGFAGFGTTKA